jgi:phage terminase Nu1 subunit (DNA packaging protein)
MTADADRVRIVHTGDKTVDEKLRTAAFIQYLRQSKAGPVAVGDRWSEVVSDGCGQTTPAHSLCARSNAVSESVRKQKLNTNRLTAESIQTVVTSFAR